jgi:hypothetical protein
MAAGQSWMKLKSYDAAMNESFNRWCQPVRSAKARVTAAVRLETFSRR